MQRCSMQQVNRKIEEAVMKGLKVIIRNAEYLYGITSDLKSGEIRVEGSVGDYLGVLNHGVRILVEGSVSNYLCDCA